MRVLIVPGLRDEVAQHWQSLLAARLGERALSVPALGREQLDLPRRVALIEAMALSCDEPPVIVAHSAGCITLAHWARQTQCAVRGALLATPPDFERPLPAGYPSLTALMLAGWLPVPRTRLPFAAIVAASRNDELGSYLHTAALARDWGAELKDLGEVGHLNPASGFGDWPAALELVEQLAGR